MWVFSLLIRGYRFGSSNHVVYLPQIFKIADPKLYVNDIAFTYPVENSFFFYILGKLSTYLNLEVLMFFLYLIFSFLFILAVFKISKLIFNNDYIGYLAVLLLIIIKPTLGTDQTFRILTFPITLVIPLALFSIYYFLKNRFIIAFLLLGFAFDIHGLTSSYVFMIYIIYFVLKFKSVNKKSFFSGFFLFLVLVTPLLLSSSETTSMSFYKADVEWLDLMKIIDNSHSIPLNWTINNYLLTVPLLFVGLLVFLFLIRNKNMLNNSTYHKKVLVLMIGVLVLMLSGFLFAEIYPIEIIIVLQLFRSSLFLVIFIMIYTAFLLFALIQSKSFANNFKAFAIFSVLFFYDYVTLIIALPFLVFTIFFYKPKHLYKIILIYLFFLFISLIFFFNLIGKVFAHVRIPFLIFLLLTLFYFIYKKYYKNLDFNKFLFCSLLILLLITSLVSIFVHRDISEPFGSFRQHFQFPSIKQVSPKIDMELWISNNTEKDSLFLIPFYISNFRVYAKRSVFFDYISTGPIFFSKNFAREWSNRMHELGITEHEYNNIKLTDEVYNKLTKDRIEQLKEKYNIDYAVFKADKELHYNISYKNDEYVIYCLKC